MRVSNWSQVSTSEMAASLWAGNKRKCLRSDVGESFRSSASDRFKETTTRVSRMTRSPARHNSFEHGRIPLSTAKRTNNIVKRSNKLEGNRSSRAIRFLRKRAAYKTLAIKMMNLLASRKFQFFVVLLISLSFFSISSRSICSSCNQTKPPAYFARFAEHLKSKRLTMPADSTVRVDCRWVNWVYHFLTVSNEQQQVACSLHYIERSSRLDEL